MAMQTSHKLIICCLASILLQSFAEDLELVQVIFRHGDRAPNFDLLPYYPSDPYANETWYPHGWDGLTNVGKRRAYDLGVFLKERYGGWLGDIYLKDEVDFRSSHMDRTIMSAQLVAAGLFPPKDIQRWNENLNWQPIPVFANPISMKNLYDTHMQCPRLVAMRHEILKTDAHLIQRDEELKGFYEFLSRNIGTTAGQLETFLVYHQLFSEFSANLALPEWTKGIFPEGQMERIASYQFIVNSYNKSMIQLEGGVWIQELLKNVDGYLNKSRSQKAIFHGAHEYNIAAILVALGVFERHVPFYCSTIMFELSKIEGNLYVKVLYKDKDIVEELVIPGCGVTNCPLETFRQLLEDVVFTGDVEAACQIKN